MNVDLKLDKMSKPMMRDFRSWTSNLCAIGVKELGNIMKCNKSIFVNKRLVIKCVGSN